MRFESGHDGEIRASLGLHRGRRAAVALLALAGLGALGLFVSRDEPTVEVPVVAAPTPPTSASAPGRAPAKRRSRTVRVVEAGRREQRVVPDVAGTAEKVVLEVEQELRNEPEIARVVEVEQELRNEPEIAREPREVAVVEVEQKPREVPVEVEPLEVEQAPAPRDAVVESAARLAESEPEPSAPPQAPPPERPEGNGEAIARAIADAKRAAVRECFERELKQQPKLAGTVVVELDLAAPDRVEALRVSDDLARPEFTRCVTAAMQGVRFAALDEDVSVRVPYALSPVQR